MKITAVLITKEKEYPEEVLNSLQFDEVLIKTECPNILTRYELALKAKNDIIYVQDDDCIVNCKELLDHYNDQLTNFISYGHKNAYENSGITLIGWGALFPKKMVDFSRYLNKFGDSDLFKREADRVFTYLNQPFNSIVTTINHLPSATAIGRMYTTSEHWETLNQIKEQLCTLDNTK